MTPEQSRSLDRLADCIRPFVLLLAFLIAVFVVGFGAFFLFPPVTAEALSFMAGALVVLTLLTRAVRRAHLNWRSLRPGIWPAWDRPLAVGGLLATMLVGAVLHQLVNQFALTFTVPVTTRGELITSQEIGLYLLAMLVFVPVAEELTFRYGFQRRMQRRIGTWPAVLLTSLLFAILHGPSPAAIVAALVLGVAAGVIAAKVGFIALPVALHAGWNVSGCVELVRW
jgi:membrane protease YdiL (CAAX protease family)